MGPTILYRHHRGGLYMLVAIAETHNHNGDLDAVYISMERGAWRTRPWRRDSRDQDSWIDMVEWPDKIHRDRFVPERSDLAALFEGT
jgi:hypothetical protein